MCLDSDRWERVFFGDQNLSRQPWEPQVSCFCFLGLWTLGGRRLLKIFECCLNTNILCVNGFQLFSLLIILMWIKTQGNMLQRTVWIPCGILLYCILYFVGMFYGLVNFHKGVFFFFLCSCVYDTRNLTRDNLIQTLFSQIVHKT